MKLLLFIQKSRWYVILQNSGICINARGGGCGHSAPPILTARLYISRVHVRMYLYTPEWESGVQAASSSSSSLSIPTLFASTFLGEWTSSLSALMVNGQERRFLNGACARARVCWCSSRSFRRIERERKIKRKKGYCLAGFDTICTGFFSYNVAKCRYVYTYIYNWWECEVVRVQIANDAE